MQQKLVEVSQDALGFLLTYAKDHGDFREGDPVGKPDYYRSRAAAVKAMRAINDGKLPMGDKIGASKE